MKTLTRICLLSLVSTVGGLVLSPVVQAQQLPSSAPPSWESGGVGISPVGRSDSALPLDAPAMQVPGTMKLPIKGIRFVGNTVYPQAQLQSHMQLLLPPQGITFAELTAAVDRVARYYRTQGYMAARAYIPRQTTTPGGVMQVTILEGLHTVPKIVNTSKVTSSTVQSVVSQALCDKPGHTCEGALITDRTTERAYRLLNDLPGVQATASFVPSTQTGAGTLAIDVKPSSLPKSSVGIDNYGSKYTGIYRLNAATAWDNLQGMGDQLALSGSASDERIWSGALGYSLLAGYTGTRIGLTFSHGQYLLGDAFKELNAHGDADTLSIFASHPLVRHRDHNLFVRGGLDYKVMKDSIEKTNKHFDKRNNTYNLALSGDVVDSWLGGGYSTMNLTASGGDLRLLDAESRLNDTTAKTAGTYNKLAYVLSRQQALGGGWTLYGSTAGQHASKNLDGSEKIGLGGPGAVRGYPAGEGAGDRGAVTSIELRHTQAAAGNGTLTYSVFNDYGWVQTNAVPWTTSPNKQSRRGFGVGMLLVKPHDYSVRMLYAGHPESAPSTADPAAKRQFWLQGSKSF